MSECVNQIITVKSGMCSKHYREALVKAKKLSGRHCEVDGCDRENHANGICLMHYKRLKRNGTTDKQKRNLGPSKHLPGYVRVLHGGYVRLAKHNTPNGKPHRVMEHRVVMEHYLGRQLEDHENVHHINGNRSDNRVENLELWSTSQPSGQRVQDKVEWAREILSKYSPAEIQALEAISA